MFRLLSQLRRRPLRRLIALIAASAIFGAGIAQAAHFHKAESTHGSDLHLQCLLCMHADRLAPPPALPAAVKAVPARCIAAVALTALCPSGSVANLYDARGPPLS